MGGHTFGPERPSPVPRPPTAQTYKKVEDIIQDSVIVESLEKTREAAKDPARVRDILAAAKERSFLTNHKPGGRAGAGAGLAGGHFTAPRRGRHRRCSEQAAPASWRARRRPAGSGLAWPRQQGPASMPSPWAPA